MPRAGEWKQLTEAELTDILQALAKGATVTTLARRQGFSDRRPLMRRLRRQCGERQYRAILKADRAKTQVTTTAGEDAHG